MESKRAVPTFNSVAAEIGELVTEKNQCYGDSFAKCGEFLRLLYPTGLEPSKYGDALSMVRIFDKQMRIATRKDAFGESPYNDICGYGLLGATADAKAAMFHTPLAPEEVKAINEAISPPSLCGTCIRQACPVDCAEHTTECVNYLAPKEEAAREEVDEWAEKDLCRKCGNVVLYCHQGKKMQKAKCDSYYKKVTVPDPLSLALPSITVEGDLEEVRKKCEEEAKEWGQCTVGSINSAVEAWDFVQARQTFSERGGDPISLRCGDIIGDLQCMRKDNPDMVEAAKRAVLIKNACRTRPDGGTGYYAPEVCEKIILSGGKEW